jgi:hypothetical protein
MKDIAAMKLAAVSDNGTRLKDFVDLACLSTQLSLSSMLEAYQYRYRDTNPMQPIRGLTYFGDINFQAPVRMLKENYQWERIAERINAMTEHPERIFPDFPTE